MSCDDSGQYQRICRDEFHQLHKKLDRLDEAIRGNGRIGIQGRLDRLEQVDKARRRIGWLVIGACISAGASGLLQVVHLLARRGL